MKPHLVVRRAPPSYIFLIWAVATALLLAGPTRAFPQSPPRTQPGIAPEGEYLANDPYILPNPRVFKLFGVGPPQIPPPGTARYGTRLGWLLGANADYKTEFVQAESTERDFAMVAYKEMQRVAKLKGQARQDYLYRLVRDLGTLEVHDAKYRTPYRLIRAAGFDYLAGAAGSAALKGAKVKGLVALATDGMTSGIADLLAQANNSKLSASNARLALLRQYFTELCGCPFPMEGRFRPPQALDIGFGAVRGRYETTLGRYLASQGKSMLRIMDRRQSLTEQEKKRLEKLSKDSPQEFAAYMVHFCYDLETVQQELLDDLKTSALDSFMINVGFGVAASLAGAGLGAAAAPAATQAATKIPSVLNMALRAVLSARSAIADPTAGALISAGTSAWSEYESLSAEERVLTGVDAVRKIALDAIRRIGGGCGCEEKPKPRKSPKPRRANPRQSAGYGYWLVSQGQYLQTDYGNKEEMDQRYGAENVLDGPNPVAQDEAAAAFCGQIANRRWDPSPLTQGAYGDFRGKTYNIGRLGGCGVMPAN